MARASKVGIPNIGRNIYIMIYDIMVASLAVLVRQWRMATTFIFILTFR
jgi:hypothetical protein